MREKDSHLFLVSLISSILLALSLIFILTPVTLANEPGAAPVAEPVRLVIPTIDLDSAVVPVGLKPIIVEGKPYKTWETPDNEVGWHNRSAPPGQVGNTVLAGHSNIKAKVFQNLNQVQIGDEILVFVSSKQQVNRYRVSQKILLQEKGVPLEIRIKNAAWIAPTQDERLTLITCANPGSTHRLIVVARPIVGD
jgi:sortase A